MTEQGTSRWRAFGRAALLLWLLSLIVFLLPSLMPGDPALVSLADRNQELSAANAAALRAEWGTDESLPLQYAGWLGQLVAGDWGIALHSGQPVRREILARLPWSAAIGGGGLLLATLLCLPAGFAAAVWRGGWFDRAMAGLAVMAQTAPAFLIAVLLAWLLAAQLRWLNVYTGPPEERLVIPTLLVALYTFPSLARVCRNAFLALREEPWFLTALAKGLSPAPALLHHAGRPVALVLLAAVTPQIAWAIGGTAVVEVIFAIPGLSQFVVESVAARDHAVLRLFLLLVALLMIGVHLAADLIRAHLDRREPACG